jgi:FixJ family two-component response regulator
VASRRYDLLFMNVQMPEMDGLEATRLLRAREDGQRRLRIVAMTANALHGARESYIAAGMDDFVAKPVQIAELVAALRRAAAARSRSAATEPPALAGVEPAEVAPPLEREAFESLQRVMGGADSAAFAELVCDFLESARSGVETMRAALHGGDAEALSRAAHSLKGMSATFGAFALVQRCEEVCQGAAGGIGPAVARSFAVLLVEHERAVAWLQVNAGSSS